jgi:hypothetical protein
LLKGNGAILAGLLENQIDREMVEKPDFIARTAKRARTLLE